jgi:beta-barrel assembly-enhancing protease
VKLLEVRLIITNMNLPAPLFAFKRSVAALLSLALMLPAGFAPMTHAQGSDSLPSLGDPASADLSPGAERKLGERIMREIRRDPDFLPDPQLTDYLNRLAGRLSENLPRYAESGALLSVELFGVRDRVVNAFALPGGFIGIHTGLITTARTESELASVIAHEMSHVSQRHIARNIAKQSQTSMVALAAILLGVLAARNNADVANAAIAFGQGAAYQGQLNFSRDMEREADRIGFNLLSEAKFSQPAMLSFFERMQAANRINDNASFPYLRSHPLTSERIGDMRSRLGSAGLTATGSKQAALSLENYAEFALMAGRARILTEGSTEGMRSQAQACASQAARADATPLESLTASYCAAYGAAKLRDDTKLQALQARMNEQLKSLAPTHPARRALSLLSAEAAVIAATEGQAAAKAQQALALIAPLRAADPLSRPITLLQADAALAARTPEATAAARESLQSWVTLNRYDSAAWNLLGRVQSAQGDGSAALRSSAEGAMLDQQWNNAADMLERARKTPGISYFDASIIDSRLREVRQHIKEEMEESRGKRSPAPSG